MRLACKLKLFQTLVVSATLPICVSLMSKVLVPIAWWLYQKRAITFEPSLQNKYAAGLDESEHCWHCTWVQPHRLDDAYAHWRDL